MKKFIKYKAQITISLAMVFGLALSPQFASAQVETVLFGAFGGKVAAVVPYVPLFPACPLHVTVVRSPAGPSDQPPLMGLFAGPTSSIYQHFLVYVPGVWLLGNYLRVPLPCPYPYPVYKIIKVGTSLPGL